MSVEAPEELPSLPAAVEVASTVSPRGAHKRGPPVRATTCVVRLAVNDNVMIEIVDDGEEYPRGAARASASPRCTNGQKSSVGLHRGDFTRGRHQGGASTAGEGVRRLETLRVLVAEDHPLFRKGMIALLSSVPEFEVVGEAATGEEAVARAAQLQPDVILMDLQMPEVSGIEAAEIMQESPNVRVCWLRSSRTMSLCSWRGRCARVRPQGRR